MRKTLVISTIFLVVALSWPFCTFGTAQETKDLQDLNRAWEDRVRLMNEAFERRAREMDMQWERFIEEQERAWDAYKKEVEEKWDKFLASTKKTWVEYGRDREARSMVDFDKGFVELDAVISASKPQREAKEEAKEKIAQQTKMLLSDKNLIKQHILEGQIKDRKGQVVTEKNADIYIKEEVIPRVHVIEKPFIPKDGIPRKKYSVKIQLVPDHLRIRAQKYLPIVKRNATRFGIRPELVLAIIHTESYFNPMARSSCGALGLMQIIPCYAGREAYTYLYDRDRILPAAYLYRPANNVELGTAYLYLLKTKHFAKIPFDPKNRYLCICGYNWGPARVKRSILSKYSIDSLSDSACFELLKRNTPHETSKYLENVEDRMLLYESLIKNQG